MSQEGSLNFISWNTRGLKKTNKFPQKFSDVLKKLEQIETDIAFIQETRVGPEFCTKLEDVKGWRIIYTVHSSKSKGVAILIKDTVPFEYICHDEDYSGGYIVLFCRLYGDLYTLVNVYKHKKDRNILERLKEYLLETQKGVLVVGGDFNTVLHPSFDRIPRTSYIRKFHLKTILDDFTAPLNLRDTWSYRHPTADDYTRHENEKYSRLDMFFMHEDRMRLVNDSKIEASEISDHDPLILKLRVQKQQSASPVHEFRCKHDRRLGKINGAEILRAINSLPDSNKERSVDSYKRKMRQMTECLKKNYNDMLKNNSIDQDFRRSACSGHRHIFNVDDLIFLKILANRLSMFVTPSLPGKIETKHKITVYLEKPPQEIKWSFLQPILQNLKKIDHAPTPDFRILDCLLPVQNKPGEIQPRRLMNGCPLTYPILKLVLRELEYQVSKTEPQCTTTVCFHRQALRIYADLDKHESICTLIKQFKAESGIKLNVLIQEHNE